MRWFGPVAPREAALAAAVGLRAGGRCDDGGAASAAALALRDGWAVSSALAQDAGPYAPMGLPAATWVDAGTPLPAGADAVAEIDAVMVRDGRARSGRRDCGRRGRAAGRRGCGWRGGTCAGRPAAPRGRPPRRWPEPRIARVLIREPRLRVVRARPAGDPVIDAVAALVTRAIEAAGGLALDHGRWCRGARGGAAAIETPMRSL